ncbi:chromate transporter [Actinoplanes sp. SE50]|uniref:chromate efflux transporter n=1 Tax=unclassified Actinoplanes TaxID=2626549 RepID=UPI00023EC0EC|nr:MULTISPECIES: chromate efflux transporter [unclassified Actinoplanes]AEV85163.1 Chromate transport protein [Actinoplanes sp. SE50/110]ATO83556.1 chromate transporter [Actinoplanes sp. SE50]SLM00963.1 chromate transporter [Actinoplanes sp. SE50/110]
MNSTDPSSHPSAAPTGPAPGQQPARDVVPFGEAVKAWLVISLQTFGGPAGQIAVMQRHLVDERRWIGQKRFLHALNYCMLLPGPEAQQLAIYVGWLLNGLRGGLFAGTLFVLPGVAALLALSAVYVGFGDTTVVTALFAGLAPAVVAIVAQAVWRVGSRALTTKILVGFAVAAFVALAVFGVPFPTVVAAAGVTGWALHRWRPALVAGGGGHGGAQDGPQPLISDDALHDDRPSARRALTILTVGLLAWFLPIATVAALTGVNSVYTQQGLFFSGTAVVTFGGAYAVLAFVAQRAVEHYGWLAAGDMVRGLALAETTPGPLIMVVQFVAFLGAYHHPGTVNPWTAGIVASLLTTWVTFVPCFLFILFGAPYVERLRGNHALSAALTGISAAVVGVIANLGLYFAVHTLFTDMHEVTSGPLHLQLPDVATIRPVPVGIAVVSAGLIFRLKWSVLRVLGISAGLGLAAGLAGLPGI